MTTANRDQAAAAETKRGRGRPRTVGLGDKRRAQLTAAAFKVFSETSYDDAAVSTIAREAGIGQGTLYRYVDGKRELLDLVVDWCIEKLMEAVDPGRLLDAAAHDPDAVTMRAEVAALGERLYALIDEHPGLLAILSVKVATVDRELKYRLLGFYRSLDSLAARVLERSKIFGDDESSADKRRIIGLTMPALALPGLVSLLTDNGDTAELRAGYIDAAGEMERYGVLGRRAR